MAEERNNTKKELNKTQAIINSGISLILSLLSIASIFFFIIPNINKAFQLKHKIESVKQDVLALGKKQQDINSYSKQELNEIYRETLYFIPEDINLGALGTRINQIAKNYNLKVQRLALNEEPQARNIAIPGMSKKTGITLPIKTITAPFTMEGSKKNLISFITVLTTSLEAQEFNTIQLDSAKPTKPEALWILKLQLTHLYMDYIKDVPVNPTLPTINRVLVGKLRKEINRLQDKNILLGNNATNSSQGNGSGTPPLKSPTPGQQ